ncbi:MAG: rhomboid family intramembrane serine protease, partial [Armatimonadota bacterium]
DFWHGIVNLLGLWLFGWFVEAESGWRRFLLLSLLAHLTALKVQTVFWVWQGHSEPVRLAGSSAVVAFSMGAFCVRFRDVKVKWRLLYGWRWRKGDFEIPLWWLIVPWLFGQIWALTFKIADKPTIAHLTSFAFGVFTALLLRWHHVALCERLQREADLAEKGGRWFEAAKIWSQISQRMPANPRFWLATSHNFLRMGEFSKAQEALGKALGNLIWDERALQRACQIATEPSIQNLPAETIFALAEQLERNRRYREALQLFKKVAEAREFSKAPQALLKVAELYWRLGDEGKARQALHLFWLRYSQTHWRREAADLAAQIRWRGEQ